MLVAASPLVPTLTNLASRTAPGHLCYDSRSTQTICVKGVSFTMKRIFGALALLGLFVGNQAWSQECTLTIEGNDQIQFNTKELRVNKTCKEVTLTLKHTGQLAGNVMGHNWVLTTTADYQAVATAGQGAGPANNYVPAGDARVLAATTVIGGGQQTTVKIDTSKLTAGGDYTYFCSFPGHFVLMNGKLIVQ